MRNLKEIGEMVDKNLREVITSGKLAPAESRWIVRVEVKNTEWIDSESRGVICLEPILTGQVVCIGGGRIVNDLSAVPAEMSYATIIDKGLFLAPASYVSPSPDWLLNHSCENNLSTVGSIVMMANCNIRKGKELTVNYSTLIASVERFRMECQCRTPKCRRTITGNDWKRPDLAKRFFSEWPPFIQEKIITEQILK